MCTQRDEEQSRGDTFLACAQVPVAETTGGRTTTGWLLVEKRSDLQKEKQKTLVCPTEKEWLRVKSKVFDGKGLIPTPIGSVRVPRKIQTWLDVRCYCLPASIQNAFAWEGKAETWKEAGSALRSLSFPGVTEREMKERLSQISKPDAKFMKDLDYLKMLRCIFSVDIDGWTLGRDAAVVHAALLLQGLSSTRGELRRHQEIGAWIMDVAWTELTARGDEKKAWFAYTPVPNVVYAVMKGKLEDEPLAGRGPGNVGDL